MPLTLATASLVAVLRLGEPLPPLAGETLQGARVQLPADGQGSTTLVLVTFSRAAGEAARVWADRFATEFRGAAGVGFYSVMFLADAPSFVRGMILGGMRRGLPADRQARTLVIEEPADAWRGDLQAATAAPPADADGPFALLLDGQGKVVWLHAGALSEAGFAQLVAAARRPVPVS